MNQKRMHGGKAGRMPQTRDGKQQSVADSVRILMRQWKPAPTDKNFSTKIQNQFRRGQNILNLRLSCYLALSQVLDPAEIMRLYEFERVDSEQFRREQWRRQEKSPKRQHQPNGRSAKQNRNFSLFNPFRPPLACCYSNVRQMYPGPQGMASA